MFDVFLRISLLLLLLILQVLERFSIKCRKTKTKVIILANHKTQRQYSGPITIHRCQGDTLNEAVVDFPKSTREHMHDVGLSRVRNSSALHILNFE